MNISLKIKSVFCTLMINVIYTCKIIYLVFVTCISLIYLHQMTCNCGFLSKVLVNCIHCFILN